jgi:hypothetical protein
MTAATPAAGQEKIDDSCYAVGQENTDDSCCRTKKKNWLTNPGQKLAGQHELSSEQHIQNSPPANIPSHPASWPVLSVLNMLADIYLLRCTLNLMKH